MSLHTITADSNPSNVVYCATNICAFQHQRPIALIPGTKIRDNMQDIVDALDIGMGRMDKKTIGGFE